MSTDTANTANKGGLEDVVAGTSAISSVDGYAGRLAYRGIDVHDLAAHSTFEETAYLLWHGRLPTRQGLAVLALPAEKPHPHLPGLL